MTKIIIQKIFQSLEIHYLQEIIYSLLIQQRPLAGLIDGYVSGWWRKISTMLVVKYFDELVTVFVQNFWMLVTDIVCYFTRGHHKHHRSEIFSEKGLPIQGFR